MAAAQSARIRKGMIRYVLLVRGARVLTCLHACVHTAWAARPLRPAQPPPRLPLAGPVARCRLLAPQRHATAAKPPAAHAPTHPLACPSPPGGPLQVLDLSKAAAMMEMRPSRLAVMAAAAKAFVRAFFEQNPLSQLGILVMRNGVAARLTELSGSPESQVAQLSSAMATGAAGGAGARCVTGPARARTPHASSTGTTAEAP